MASRLFSDDQLETLNGAEHLRVGCRQGSAGLVVGGQGAGGGGEVLALPELGGARRPLRDPDAVEE